MNILVAGELNVDLVLQNPSAFPTPGQEVLVEDASLTLGSASAICASGLARLGNRVRFSGKLGCDAWGDLCLESLVNLGIDCSSILRDPAVKTGVTVSITSTQDRALVTFLGSIALLCAQDVRGEDIRESHHLHLSSFFLQEALRPEAKALLALASRTGLTTSLDPGFDPSGRWGEDLIDALAEVDVFLPNEVELAGLTRVADPREGLRKLQNGRTATIAKLGSAGCLGLAPDGELIHVDAFPVTPVDTTGAGDSFNAGFLHAWLRGEGLREAMRFGAACGAISTQGLGGTTRQAGEEEARALMALHRDLPASNMRVNSA